MVITEHNVERQPEGEKSMDIDIEQTDSRKSALQNYSVSQHEILVVFDAIPRAAEIPEEFLSFHRNTRRIPQLLPVQRPADNYFTSLLRMFEALSSYGSISSPRPALEQQSAANFLSPAAGQFVLDSRALRSQLSTFGNLANFLPPAALAIDSNSRNSRELRTPLSLQLPQRSQPAGHSDLVETNA